MNIQKKPFTYKTFYYFLDLLEFNTFSQHINYFMFVLTDIGYFVVKHLLYLDCELIFFDFHLV